MFRKLVPSSRVLPNPFLSSHIFSLHSRNFPENHGLFWLFTTVCHLFGRIHQPVYLKRIYASMNSTAIKWILSRISKIFSVWLQTFWTPMCKWHQALQICISVRATSLSTVEHFGKGGRKYTMQELNPVISLGWFQQNRGYSCHFHALHLWLPTGIWGSLCIHLV